MAEKSTGVQQMHPPACKLAFVGAENNFAEQWMQIPMKPRGQKRMVARSVIPSDYSKGIAGFVRNEKEKNDANPCTKEKSSIGVSSLSTFMAVIILNLVAVHQTYFPSNAVPVKGSKGI